MKLRGSTKEKIIKYKNGENITHLENIEVLLVHYNIVYKKYQHNSWVLSTLVPDKSISQLLDI